MSIFAPLKLSSFISTLLVGTALLGALSGQAQAERPELSLLVAAPKDAIAAYQGFTLGKDVLQINDLSGANLWRDVAELLLFHQALLLGGFTGDITLVESSNYRRMLRRLSEGHTSMIGTTVWRENVIENDQPLLLSKPVIRADEYRVGLYTSKNNTRALSVRSRGDLSKLSAVTSHHWSADWHAMRQLPFRFLHDSPHLTSMLKMVWAERVDVLMVAFSSAPDFELRLSPQNPEQVLIPIPGITIVLRDSRHWVASQAEPLSRQAFHALTQGLIKLRQQGRVVKAFQQAGVLDPRVQNWTVLNPQEQSVDTPNR